MNTAVAPKENQIVVKNECCHPLHGLIDYAHPQPDEVCLVLGSGEGLDALELAAAVGSNGYVYGVELSDVQVQKAFSNAEQQGQTNVEFLHGNGNSLKITNEVVDLVLADCGILNNAQRVQVWDEVYRVLRKGGRFVVSDLYAAGTENDNDSPCRQNALTRGAYIEMLYHAGFTSLRIVKETKKISKFPVFIITGEKPANSQVSQACRI